MYKHIEIDCHSISEKLKEGLIQHMHISTKFQVADLLTKGLLIPQHHFLSSKLGILYVFHPPASGGIYEIFTTEFS